MYLQKTNGLKAHKSFHVESRAIKYTSCSLFRVPGVDGMMARSLAKGAQGLEVNCVLFSRLNRRDGKEVT